MNNRRIVKAVVLAMLILPLTLLAEFFGKHPSRRVITRGRAT